MIRWLDHVNLRTVDVERLVAFYVDVIGLRRGERPLFDFPGAWLYVGDRPIIHIVWDAQASQTPSSSLRLEHFALAAEPESLQPFLGRLHARGIAFRQSERIDGGTTVVNLHDPDGNRLHVDFAHAAKAGRVDEPPERQQPSQ